MAEFEVPQAAVEAGVAALFDIETGSDEDLARIALAAAAPHIAAAALRQAAEEHQPVMSPGAVGIGAEPDVILGAIRCSLCNRPYPCLPAVRLRQLADELVPPTEDTREAIMAVLGDGDPVVADALRAGRAATRGGTTGVRGSGGTHEAGASRWMTTAWSTSW